MIDLKDFAIRTYVFTSPEDYTSWYTKTNAARKHHRTSFSVNEKNFFSWLPRTSTIKQDDFHIVLFVMAYKYPRRQFWVNKEDIKNDVHKDMGKVLGSQQHYANGNFLGTFYANSLRFEYLTLFVPKTVKTDTASLVEFVRNEMEVAEKLRYDVNDHHAQFDEEAFTEELASQSLILSMTSQNRITFLSEMMVIGRFLNKVASLLQQFYSNGRAISNS